MFCPRKNHLCSSSRSTFAGVAIGTRCNLSLWLQWAEMPNVFAYRSFAESDGAVINSRYSSHPFISNSYLASSFIFTMYMNLNQGWGDLSLWNPAASVWKVSYHWAMCLGSCLVSSAGKCSRFHHLTWRVCCTTALEKKNNSFHGSSLSPPQ